MIVFWIEQAQGTSLQQLGHGETAPLYTIICPPVPSFTARANLFRRRLRSTNRNAPSPNRSGAISSARFLEMLVPSSLLCRSVAIALRIWNRHVLNRVLNIGIRDGQAICCLSFVVRLCDLCDLCLNGKWSRKMVMLFCCLALTCESWCVCLVDVGRYIVGCCRLSFVQTEHASTPSLAFTSKCPVPLPFNRQLPPTKSQIS